MNYSYQTLLFILLLFISSCSTPKYIITKQSLLKYEDLDNTLTRYIPVDNNLLHKSQLVDSVCNLIINGKTTKLYNLANNTENTPLKNYPDYYLAKSLALISFNDYYLAKKYVDMISNDESCLKRLISIDLEYEIDKMNDKDNYTFYLQKYQDLIDSFPNDLALKKIISIRIKSIRYHN